MSVSQGGISMTVAELISALKKFDREMEVTIAIDYRKATINNLYQNDAESITIEN